MEVWKDIPGYEGYYQVSTKGNVRSLGRWIINKRGSKCYFPGKELKKLTDKYGYHYVNLYQNGVRHYTVHRLVALAFIPNPSNYPVINHKDEVKTNNNVFNLEWCTTLYNLTYGTCQERAHAKRRGVPSPWCQGKRNYFYGKHFDGALNPRARKVNQYDLDGNLVATYDCMKDAANVLGISNRTICDACRGKIKVCKGYKWAYAS